MHSEKLPLRVFGSAIRDRAFNTVRCRSWIFVLPNPQHKPASFRQCKVDVAVTRLIALELSVPVVGASLRKGAVKRATMPEAPVNKYSNA